MKLQNLETFMLVAQQGSFAAAARTLRVDPSSVSRTIKQLEESLGFRLFQRSTRSLILSDAGAQYLRGVEPLLAELVRMGDSVKLRTQAPEGRVRITASAAFGQVCILPLLEEFKRCFPNIQLDCLFTDSVLDLVGDNIDLAFRLGAQVDPNLIGFRLFEFRYSVCASPSFLAERDVLTDPQLLSLQPCLSMDINGYRDKWLFAKSEQEVEVQFQPHFCFSSALALKQGALEGLGVALLADFLIQKELNEGALIRVLPDYAVHFNRDPYIAWLLYPSRRYVPARTRVVLDFFKHKLSSENSTNQQKN